MASRSGVQTDFWSFLRAEGLEDEVRHRLRVLGDRFWDGGELGSLEAWLATVPVRPSTATRRMGSVSVCFDSGRARMRITALPMRPWKRRDTILHEVAHLVAFWISRRALGRPSSAGRSGWSIPWRGGTSSPRCGGEAQALHEAAVRVLASAQAGVGWQPGGRFPSYQSVPVRLYQLALDVLVVTVTTAMAQIRIEPR